MLNKTKKILILILIIIFIGGIIFYQSQKKSNPENKTITKNVVNNTLAPSPITPEITQKALLKKAFLTFPSIETKEEIFISDLPQELLVFIKKEGNILKIDKISYTNKKSGFYIQYDISNIPAADLFNEFKMISNENNWKILTARRANLFAFLDLENSIYQLRISQIFKNENKNEIIIEVVIK
jgi:hypothetical protein